MRAAHDSRVPDALKNSAPYLLLAFAVVAVYGNVYRNAFLYDDTTLILNNSFLRDWHFLPAIFTASIDAGADISSSYYRPLQILLYFLIYQIAGLSLAAFHALNIGLHAANACLIYALGRKLNFNAWAVFFAALIWAVHPAHVEAIAYISGTADPLCVFFSLVGLLILLPDVTPKKMILALPFYGLALLSKEEALTFPLMVMSGLFLLNPQRFRIQTYFRTWPLWQIAIIYAVLHILVFSEGWAPSLAVHTKTGDALSYAQLPWTFLATLPTYVHILFWPSDLHYEHSFPSYSTPFSWPVLEGLTLVAMALMQICWRRQRQNLPLSWGLMWFGSLYALHAGLLLSADKAIYEHWIYLPSAGLLLGIAETMALQTENNPPMVKYARSWCVLAVFMAIGLGWHTLIQNRTWQDALSLYGHAFAKGETAPRAHNNLGMAYAEKGDYLHAREEFEYAITLSHDTIPEAEYNLAALLMLQAPDPSTLQAAIEHLQNALRINPDYYAAASKLAQAYGRSEKKAQAAFYQAKAEELHKKFTSFMP